MKTKSLIMITLLTGFISSQVLAQVDTTKNRKSKTDTTWNKKDTAWKKEKRDTNQVSSNLRVQDESRAMIGNNNQSNTTVFPTTQFFIREDKNAYRRTRIQAHTGTV